jgi:hypothetical protein
LDNRAALEHYLAKSSKKALPQNRYSANFLNIRKYWVLTMARFEL